jgi:hypothetical protein
VSPIVVNVNCIIASSLVTWQFASKVSYTYKFFDIARASVEGKIPQNVCADFGHLFFRVGGRPPPERTKDTRDKGSHKTRFISTRLGSEHRPDAAGFNKDPERKV